MKRPAFQFYPGDWRANTKLRRCTHQERGIWIDVLCLMHDSDEYGVLRWPLKEIAGAVGCKVADLRGLHEKGVLKGGDPGEACPALIYTPVHGRRRGDPVALIADQAGPLWFSSRMVVDEYVRSKRGVTTRFASPTPGNGGAPKPAPDDSPKPAPMPPFGDGSSSSSSSSPLPPSAEAVGLGEGKSRRRRKQPTTSPPESFEVDEAMWAWAEEQGVTAEVIPIETDKFLDHHRAKGSMFSDWRAAWQNWMRKVVEFRKGRAA